MTRKCDCGNPLPEHFGKGRPRKWCEQCKPSRNRSESPRLASVPTRVITERPSSPPTAEIARWDPADQPESLHAATFRDLRAVDRQGTTRGLAALHLARLLDAGQYNAQGAAALVKAHREELALALEGTTPTADVIDVIFGASG